MKDIRKWTRKDFKALPHRERNQEVKFSSLVIIPLRKLHDSGWRLIDYAAVDENGVPFILLSGSSDVIHINGIGGYGKYNGSIPKLIEPLSWSMDCLATSGYMMLWCNKELTCGPSLSSFEIYTT